MVKKKAARNAVKNAEEMILDAARNVFRREGYAGARMQQIADEAKINKAMLHYYFRSKELLFERVFIETMQGFLGTVAFIVNNKDGWENKIRTIADKYTDFLIAHPDVPLFVMNELNRGDVAFLKNFPIPKILHQSVFMQQLKEARAKKKIRDVDPLQVMLMIISGLVFPFIAKPLIKNIGGMNDKTFLKFLEERKTIIPEMVIGYLLKKQTT